MDDMPDSPFTDLSRPPLRESALQRALVVAGGLWTQVRVVAETGSTNADVAEAARSGTGSAGYRCSPASASSTRLAGSPWSTPP
jgi:BirA family transcriptional regulator, biotin operon repressor / biotin---[acetyl-CoA-carboxylase] ligase